MALWVVSATKQEPFLKRLHLVMNAPDRIIRSPLRGRRPGGTTLSPAAAPPPARTCDLRLRRSTLYPAELRAPVKNAAQSYSDGVGPSMQRDGNRPVNPGPRILPVCRVDCANPAASWFFVITTNTFATTQISNLHDQKAGSSRRNTISSRSTMNRFVFCTSLWTSVCADSLPTDKDDGPNPSVCTEPREEGNYSPR